MPYETILTELADNILTITINRPDKLNALNTQMIHDLIDAFDFHQRPRKPLILKQRDCSLAN